MLQQPIQHSRSLIKTGWSHVINLVLPPRCPVTGELVGAQGTLHPSFWAGLSFIQTPFCKSCGTPFGHQTEEEILCAGCLRAPKLYHSMRSVWRYDQASAALILKFKHADALHLAPLLGGFLVRSGVEILQEADLLLPVPLHRWRMLKRKYNQAAELTKQIGKISRVPYQLHVLRRQRATESQGRKTTTERQENLRGAFQILPQDTAQIAGKNLVLIDDVYTSGATVHECTRTLLAHGAARVDVLCLARVCRD